MRVHLTWAQVAMAAGVGVWRHSAALQAGRKDRREELEEKGWLIHIEGAIGEYAAALAIGVPWEATVNTFKRVGDLGSVEVRTRSKDWHELQVRPDDPLDRPYVLVTGTPPIYTVRGWVWGHEAEEKGRKLDPGDKGMPAWFVPQEGLRPIDDELRRLARRLYAA